LIRKRVVLGLLFAVLFGLGWWVGRGRATGDLYGNLDLFVEIMGKVEQNYVGRVEPEKLINGAIKGMLRDLDPYSQYLDARAFTNLQNTTQGSFGGIGVEVSVRDNYPTVISPIEGTPAWSAGLRSGDIIAKIDGQSAAGLTIDEAAQRLRGPEGTKVTVTLRREGDPEERDVTLERKIIVTHSVRYAFMAGNGIGYVRLSSFTEKSGAELSAALQRLRGEGASRAILDLRQNPGGLLDQAVGVAEQFLPKGTLVVYTRGRGKVQDQRFYAAGTGAESRWPLVVLVDNASASAAEIVAGALQDLDRALLVGRMTYGKGSVQSVFPLKGSAAALKLTTALYYTPSGRSIHRAAQGVPDTLDEEDDGGPAEAPGDSMPRPVFHTASGRAVFGGGGITPDVTLPADTLPPLALEIERRGLPFRFANRWVNTHPEARAGGPIEASMWREFAGFLGEEKLVADRARLESERAPIERSLRRELARRLAGDAAAARVALEGDASYARALEILRRAKVPRDVFAAVGVEAGAARGRAAR
jgi:carboxyl-terminal processing protease